MSTFILICKWFFMIVLASIILAILCVMLEKLYSRKVKSMETQEEKDFNEMAKVVESYMQKYCHPHNTIIATLDGIELVEGVQAKPFEVLD